MRDGTGSGNSQGRIEEEILSAIARRGRGETLTDREWLLVQYSSPACPSCGTHHREGG